MVDDKNSSLSREPDDMEDGEEEELNIDALHGADKRRRRRRIKVRKRVRIKKKISPKKKAKKLVESVIWIIVIAAFIGTLLMLVMQLDLNSKHAPKKKTSELFQLLNNDPALNLNYI